jgi:hypothetical protein
MATLGGGLVRARTSARSEGEFTGLATLAPEFVLAKQIEWLRETVPRATSTGS